ncbi:hypothetical protein B0H15DRAFT_830689 [Mycena belliarum]|uniref:F-box domain-containing protein n=1 Tax=Mycena belliarum TaxID=1033014 RepID=A0AAD6XTN2_9AGAR|nr:hypothetical protein B0H15DRAFT_830689 [Mycena belliae]
MFHPEERTAEAQGRKDLLQAEAELARLESMLFYLPFPPDDLVSQHEDVERQVISLRVALAPCKKLPAELLAEVFLFCIAHPTVLPPTSHEPLLVLTQVCSGWRELALQTPQLWASISVSLTSEDTDVPRLAEITKQWISRAGTTCPLSITVECSGPYANIVCEDPELVSAFGALIVSHAQHLRDVDLALPITALLPFFKLPPGTFPCLQTLALRPLLLLSDMVTPETGYAPWHWPCTALALEEAPLVREVTYSPTPLFKLAELEVMLDDIMERAMTPPDLLVHPFFAPSFPLPWAQLSIISFPFTALPVETWCAAITDCPGLEHFEVAIKPSEATREHRRPLSDQLIHLAHLHYLSISAFSGGGDELLDRLVAPKLTVFTLMGVHFSIASLKFFHARSNCLLETFIPVIHFPAEDVVPLFAQFFEIRTLIILAVSTDHFPAPFWARVGRAELLPNMEGLLIRPTAAQAPLLVDMIDARWAAAIEGSGLALAVGFCDVKPAHLEAVNDALRRLEKYAEGGRVVNFLTVC